MIGQRYIPKLEADGSQSVILGDQTTRPIDFYLTDPVITPTTLAADTVEGAYTITLTSAVGIANGNSIALLGADKVIAAKVLSIAGAPTLTLDTPIDGV